LLLLRRRGGGVDKSKLNFKQVLNGVLNIALNTALKRFKRGLKRLKPF